MEFDPKQRQWDTADAKSFAYPSTNAIDDVHKAVGKSQDAAAEAEGKQLISQLAALKYEVQHNRELTPIPDDGHPDITGYNAELSARSPLHWHSAPWLFSECYLYRRMASIFHLSSHWKTYDYFSATKTSTFRSSRAAVIELAHKYVSILEQLSSPSLQSLSEGEKREADRVLFTEMLEISLWGNATDLSLLASASYVDIASLQGSEARKRAEANVLVNDAGRAFEVLAAARDRDPDGARRVDIVLDNAGFELFVDLVLAAYLTRAGLATVVVFHPKNLPWFVSDVVPRDFAQLFEVLLDPETFYARQSDEEEGTTAPLTAREVEAVKRLAEDWTELYADGRFVLRPDGFWTESGSFWRMAAPQQKGLLSDLRESELVIFKGDLNYRKLTADAHWEPTTPFQTAIGPLGAGSGLRVLALRTCKADVIVGLPPGKDEGLQAAEGGGRGDGGARRWAWTGKWAVIQYSDGKKEKRRDDGRPDVN